MNYTQEQYALLERLSGGIDFNDLNRREREALWHLEEQKLVSARVDIRDDLWMLTQEGERVLADHQASLRKDAEVAEEKAQKKRQQRFDNKISVLNLFMPLVSFFLGLIVEHYGAVIDTVTTYGSALIGWVGSLFG